MDPGGFAAGGGDHTGQAPQWGDGFWGKLPQIIENKPQKSFSLLSLSTAFPDITFTKLLGIRGTSLAMET